MGRRALIVTIVVLAAFPLGFAASLAVRGINLGNVFVDRDSSQPQPSPSECEA